MLTEKIQREMTDLDLSVEDAYTLCYLQWIPEEAEIDVPDTSLRRMLDIDRELDLCPIESHFMFILEVFILPVRFNGGRTSAFKYYNYVRKRLGRF